MAAAGRLVFRRNNDVKAAMDAAGHVFVKGPRQSSADGHGGLVFRSSLKAHPSVSIKASANAVQDGSMVVDATADNTSTIPGRFRPSLLFKNGNRAVAEFTYVQSSGYLRARGSFVQSFGRRKNAGKALQIERDNLRDAFLEIHKRKFPGFKLDPIPGGVSFWFKQDEVHQATHVHAFPPWRGIAFLPWHREIVNRLEDMLRGVDPTVSLHYWDWDTDPGNSSGVNLMTADFMGSPTGAAGEPWLSVRFYDPAANPHRDSGTPGNAADPPLEITRSKQGGAPNLPESDADVVNAETFPQMRAILENRHNSAHGYIGGTLGDPHSSFRDPFVFLLHSNVDRIFASWQLKPGKAWRLDPQQVYGSETNTDIDPNAGIYDPGILTPLDPWAGDPNNHPDVQRIRPWTAPENEQVNRNSKHPSVVIPRLYAEYV